MIKKFDILVKRLTKSKFAGILGYCMWDKKKLVLVQKNPSDKKLM